MAKFLFYRIGGTENAAWRRVLATAEEIPAKRMGLFTAGYATVINDTGIKPEGFSPAGVWPGKGMDA